MKGQVGERRGFKWVGGGAEVVQKKGLSSERHRVQKTPFMTRGGWQGVGDREKD